jgi:hypothetical protein
MPAPNIYPNRKASSFWERLKIAWRIIYHGEYFPAPYEWYDKLYPLVSNEYSAFAEQAVMKSEVAFAGKDKQETKRQEALQWMRHYASAAGKSPDIQPWIANFLVEWWVARKKGRL